MTLVPPTVSIVIPVLDKLAFTRQCLDRIARHQVGSPSFDIVVVDNASTDGTREFLDEARRRAELAYVRNDANLGFAAACNAGAGCSHARYLLFLNNDTLVTAGWLRAMVSVAESDSRVGVVGIKQLFPYTNRIHHTGIVFGADRRPHHIYPDADAALPHVNRQREYQAVTGSCLLIDRELFVACGGFDEEYRNGYEDVDLCLSVRKHGRSVICCTDAFIYHYGQISDTRTDDDDGNLQRLLGKWGESIEADEHEFLRQDLPDIERAGNAAETIVAPRSADPGVFHFADDLSSANALTWVTTGFIEALDRQGAAVTMRRSDIHGVAPDGRKRLFERLMLRRSPIGGVQIRWSHYWPEHLETELDGRLNLDLFVINYHFARPGSQPWDYWMQNVSGNRHKKLPLSSFSHDVLIQTGVPADDCLVLRPGYSPEILQVEPPRRSDGRTRLLTVTNSHDLERYGTSLLLEAYWSAFTPTDEVVLVVKDYGASANDTTLRDLLGSRQGHAAVEYVTEFTDKQRLIELYKSCDAFVSAHRGEGYGMKILDALACGLPVITPLFGGPTDFCTTENCLPVDFSVVRVGDCLDTRSLRIANAPMWAEPDVASLAAQMRRLVRDRDEARRLGERARRDVIDRFTWDNAATDLMRFAAARPAASRSRRPVITSAKPGTTERSPYWLGCRVSVIIPTFNRAAKLMECLSALERQSVLPHEFEVIVVDDGSTDDTRVRLETKSVPFALTCIYQENAGPGAARNEGLAYARGGLVLFIGDDILADDRLIESHLEAHARVRNPIAAILGHIDWATETPPSQVMRYVCGPSALQFGYSVMPNLSRLDHRFFYTSNISAQRQFLAEAAADNVRFDPSFSAAGFEDSEFAYRLEARGLEIVYEPAARARHDHWMDLDAFSRREHAVGRMAVVYFRKHPALDDELQVRWLGDWSDAVEEVTTSADMEARLHAIDARTGALLRNLAASLEARVASDAQPGRDALDAAFGAIFDIARTRGKAEEWYASVTDQRKVRNAVGLVGCVRALQCLALLPEGPPAVPPSLAWLEPHGSGGGGIEAGIAGIELRAASDPYSVAVIHGPRRSQTPTTGNTRRRNPDPSPDREPGGTFRVSLMLRRLVRRWLRMTDMRIQHTLGRHLSGRWLGRYRALRGRLKDLLARATR